MTLSDLKKKNTSILIENNIWEDIVYSTDKIDVLIKKINEKLKKEKTEFVIVVLDKKTNEVVNIVTFFELDTLFNIFNKKVEEKKENIVKVTIKSITSVFSLNENLNFVHNDTNIGKIIEIFSNDEVNALAVLNDKNQYIGKVKKTTLRKKIEKLES